MSDRETSRRLGIGQCAVAGAMGGSGGSPGGAGRGRGVPGGFRPAARSPPSHGPRPSAVGGGGLHSVPCPVSLPLGARRLSSGSPPPRPAAASPGARLPRPAARWAAGTPPPQARARAEALQEQPKMSNVSDLLEQKNP
ncbi:overexpressed in colon carcinoma 1 protein isoform X3 [Macaca fascicularis]|uniref:overexpressed in colon carcinoma 1 protein isoform X3 n=1 Tax=Macaca fascicularis TaxID=9541 RepID=UPI0032B0251D